jgi:hypothetical protein
MSSTTFDSNELSVSAVKGINTSTPNGAPPESVGVEGQSDLGVAVSGHSISGFGVHGSSQSNFGVRAVSIDGVGLRATSVSGRALEATADQSGIGVVAQSDSGDGVFGISDTGIGVHGTSRTNHAVHGESAAGRGVVGVSQTFVGVSGFSTTLDGVLGNSDTGIGVHGTSRTNHAVHGESAAGRGVVGVSQTFVGVSGFSTTLDGVLGVSESGIGVHGKGAKLAGFFEGNVEVTGDLSCPNADCAEEFEICGAMKVEPGTVMVLGTEGTLSESRESYDKRVAGVISGAGHYKPAIVLDKSRTTANRQPIALMGKVFCKVDAQFGPIEIGDLLTTSPTPGHAMKTTDPYKAFGAVIGKALKPMTGGQGLIPILIALQ